MIGTVYAWAMWVCLAVLAFYSACRVVQYPGKHNDAIRRELWGQRRQMLAYEEKDAALAQTEEWR